ncbi:uncharacterized protein LODBEIA_P14630 [Lodderomyces beijingensis]|uniref:Uncharacterized protein n=1 Tax=Lodderomyces beijingensis TaxID=1775926 RepID=A0ABP0ZGE4_9ASCO
MNKPKILAASLTVILTILANSNLSFFTSVNQPSKDSTCYQYESNEQFQSFLKSRHHHQNGGNLCVQKDTGGTGRVNATFLMLCRNAEVYQVLETLQTIQDRFNNKFHYDYTFLNDEPFTDEFIYLVGSYIPFSKVNFGLIPQDHWSYPHHINVTACAEIRANFANVPYGDSESYRHMCRFYSGFFYKHPFVRSYEYYWRIEPGIKLHCDIQQDLFQYMHTNNKKYAFAISLFEYIDTIPSLWSHVFQYLSKYNVDPGLLPVLANSDGHYNLCHFWSNFEIARVDTFDNPEYERFFQYLDSTGGFYYERWGDAPVHTIGTMLFLKKEEIHWFANLGYHHPPYTQCPQDLDEFVENRCVCDSEDDVTWNENLSCTPHFLSYLGV